MGRRVLLVEDEWVVAADHADTLRSADYEVVGPCASVAAALEAIEVGPVDVALLDVELRNERSFSVAARLRQIGIPFLFLSGHELRALPKDMCDSQLLTKPVEPSVLIAAVQDAIPAGRPPGSGKMD